MEKWKRNDFSCARRTGLAETEGGLGDDYGNQTGSLRQPRRNDPRITSCLLQVYPVLRRTVHETSEIIVSFIVIPVAFEMSTSIVERSRIWYRADNCGSRSTRYCWRTANLERWLDYLRERVTRIERSVSFVENYKVRDAVIRYIKTTLFHQLACKDMISPFHAMK